MAKYLSDDEFFSMAEGQPEYLSDDEFFAMAAEKDDSFFSLDRAKEAALNVARLMPGMGDLGKEKQPYRSVLETQPWSAESADVVRAKNAVAGLPPEERVQYLRKIAQDDGPLAASAKKLADDSLTRQAERDMIQDEAARAAAKLPRKKGAGTSDYLALPADVGGRMEDAYRKPQDIAEENLGIDQALGLNRTELQRAGDEKNVAAAVSAMLARMARRRKYARENPGMAGLAVGSANVLAGTLNTPAVAADWLNKTAVNPVLKLVGLPEMERVPLAPGTEYLKKAASEYTPAVANMEPDDAWREGKFGAWSYAQVAIQAPQLAQLITAGSVHALQRYVLGAMGAQAAGSSYAQGDDSRIAAMKGGVEVFTEMLPFKAVDNVVDAIKVMPAGARGQLMRAIGQQVAKSSAVLTAAVATNTAEESIAQFGGNVLDKYAAGKNVGLMDGVAKAGVIGSLTGFGFAGPGIARSIHEQATGGEAAGALADALSGGQFTQTGVDASVADALRTQPGTSNAISPAATTMGAPISAPQVDAKAVVESARDAAMADIGKAQSVDEAVASANMATNLAGRAVQIDGERLLNETLQAAGLADALASAGVAQQPTAETVGAAQAAPLAGGQSTVTAATSPNYGVPNAVAPSRVVWTGRRGDGYAAPEDATRALNERQRLRPAYDWTVQQNPEGRYVLEGMPKGQNGAAQATSMPGNTMAAQMAQNAPEAAYGGGDVSVRGRPYQGDLRQQPADSGVDVDAAAAVQELAVAAGSPGGFHAVSREVALRELDAGEQRQRSMEARGLSAARSPAVPAEVLGDIENFVEAAQASFGTRPVMMSGPKDVFGVQYRGRTFFNISAIANGDRKGNLVQAIALQTIGHETTHDLEKSANPQDRADHALLRQAVLGNAKDGVVAQRVTREQKDLKRLPGESDAQYAARSQRYGEKEVVADVSGNFWTDPKFWERLYDLDKAAMRRIAYKFMEKATKLLKTVKGSRLDNETFINNIEQVREVAAQVWARKAQRGDSLFDGRDNTVSKSQSDDMLPGVNVEVAPDPRNAEAKEKWGKLTEIDKLGITKEVMDKLATKVFDKMGLSGWGVEYTSGMFEGGINPSAILRAPQGTDAQTLGEVMRVFGYLLDQKGMVAFDESNTTSDSQAGFVKVVLPKGLSTDRIDAIRKEIAAKVPQAEGDTVRDGAVVYGNFSALNDKIETLTDEQFGDAIAAVVEGMPESIRVSEPVRFHSEYDQAYWSETTYDPKGRDAYLEKTRYASNPLQDEAGRNDVRRWGRDSVFRPWLEALARSTDTRVAQLVGDKQPRAYQGATGGAQQGDAAGGRALGGRVDSGQSVPAQGRSDGGVAVDNGPVAPAPRYGTPRDGAVSVLAYHFSRQPRTSLSGSFYGQGLQGDEAKRLSAPEDADIRPRVFFYVDRGNGVMPEFGVGPHPHHVRLDNLYDATADKLGIVREANRGATKDERANKWERAILEAGFDGFVMRDSVMPQHFAVLLGSKHSAVPVVRADPKRLDGRKNIQPPPAPKQAPKSVTRTEGDTLVRRPEGSEVMEIIAARKAGLEMAAPSFKMQFGEARVLASEAPVADAVFDSVGAKFKFGEPAYSRDFDELGAFNIDAELDSLDDAMTEKDMGAIQAELMAEFEAEFGAMASKPKAGAPSKDAIAKAGLNAEDAFDFAGALKESGQGLAYDVPDFAADLVLRVSLGSDVNAPRATVELADGVAVFVNARTASKGAVEKLIARQVAGAQLRKDKHDIASAYRKNTILNLAANWKAVARKAGVFKFGEGSKADGFAEIAKSMGAFKGYRVEVTKNYGGFNVEFARESDGRGFSAEVTEHQSVRCCTMGLDGSGGLGTEFYAVMGRYAQNNGKRFLADEYLSGINSYRRTEQALSFALKSGDTGVLLPGPQNLVYGYNTQPNTQEEHDKNLARLALAGLRNVQELYPDVRRLRYDPATDRFSDSQGDAEDKVAKALKGKDARAFGLGRSTVARAVITSQIIKGEAIKADKFESPIAYSLADVGLDESMAEGWGDDAGGVQPGLRRFMAGSKIVNEDGKPIVMYHSTAQDIHAFRGKQAGAIFLSYSPRFAGDFAALSGQWMQDHWTQVLTPEQQEQAKKVAAAAVMADKSVKMAERKAMKQSIMDGKPEGMAKDAMNEAVRDMMPSGENILPVFVRATAPFDFRDKAMVDDVVGFLFDKNMAGENDKVRIRLVSEKGDRANMNARTMRELISGGAWDVIESPEVQEVIRELGHDGFFVKEDGQINLAVYEPGQVKSVFNRGTFDPLDERLSYSRRAGPKEFNYRDNYLVPELDGAFDDDSGNIAVMPALIFAKDGIRREFKSMPVRIKIGDHQRVQTGNAVKQQGLQHRIENQRKDAAYRGYITPALEGDVTEPTAAEVERAARDITLGVLDSKTAYADGSPAKIYLHSPSLNRQTVLERQRDAKGKDFWSVITVSPSDRNQMMRRYKAPTSVVGVSLNGDRTQQANDTLLGILKKLREPGKPPVTSESYILDEDGLLFHQDPARKSTNKADAPKAVKQLPRDENGRIILNRRKAQADGGVAEGLPSFSRAAPETAEFARWFGDSKVVDSDGKPLVVYHGTPNVGFTEFDGTSVGAFFSDRFDVAASYAGRYNEVEFDEDGAYVDDDNQQGVYATYLSLQNPMVIDWGGRDWGDGPEGLKLDDWANRAKRQGNDGLIVENVVDTGWLAPGLVEDNDPGTVYVAFRPEQIKSATGNNGDFDPTNPDIRYSRANGGFDLPEETRTQKARRKMQDYFLRAQVVQRAIAGQGGVVDEQTDFYRAEELSHGRTASLMKDFADHQVQPLMEKAVKLGIELDELSLYAYAMHAKERNAYIASIDPKLQDGGSGMTNDEADSILDLVKLSGDQAKFEELHTDLMTITRGNRLAMLADGLITQDEFKALEGAYENYVPLRGFEKVDEDGKPAPARSAGKGFNIRGAETIRAKGRVSRAGQIIENIIHDHQRTIARGERNHVAKVFLNFVLKNPDPDLWEIDATTTRKSIDRKTGRIARDTAIEKGEDTISVKLQGQEVYIRIKDEMLLRALRKSHADETGQLTSDLMKSVGLYSALLRNTLTRYNPEFAVVNAMRDVGFGATAVLDELGEKGVAKYMAHYAGAMAVSARNESKKLDTAREWDRWFNEYKATGGMTSGFYAKGLDEIGSDIRDMMIEAGAAPKDWSEKVRFNKATRAAKGALRVLEWAGSVSENSARVAAYRTAREMGKTPSQAASIAKNLTTNFDRKGEYGQLTNALYLFYNAAIQGTHRTAKMLKNPRVWGYMGSVTAAMVALAFHNAGEDDPEDGMAYWDKIPAHVKERNIIIMLPPGAQVEGAHQVGTKGRYVAVPVQYGLNIFHVMGYQIADVLRNQQDPVRGVNWKKAVINMASATAGAFNPFGGSVDLTSESSMIQAVLPTIFDFPYQLVSGTNAFGRDVAPFKSPFDAKPDSQNSNVRQAGGPAERVAQWLNDVTGGSEYESGYIDVSAGTLENVVRGLTGGTGAFVYDVIALGGKWAEQVGGGDPDLFVRDMPIVRRLTGETAGDVDQGLFYERRKAIQEARAIEKAANEAGAEISDKEKIALSSLNGDAGKTTRWLAEVRREMKGVQRDESLTPQERRLKLRELRAERDRLTASFNAAFMEVMREELAPSLVDE